MSFLGVDLGTSFLKGAVLDLERRTLLHIRRKPFPEAVAAEDPLCCEFDPKAILFAFRSLIDELAPLAPDCEGIVLCAQMHALVLMNQNHEAVSNCLTWRDERASKPRPRGSGSYFDAMVSQITPRERRQLGNELEPARPLCFLFWFKEQGRLAPGLVPASLPDFVISALAGDATGVDSTHASAYGAFNLESLDWHHELIRHLGLDQLHWPAIRKQGGIAGYLKVGFKSVPCYAPVGDAQAALVGSLLSAEELSVNIATGAQVSRLTGRLQLGDYQTRPYFDGKFINTLSYPPGGRALDVLVGLLTELASAQNVPLPDPWTHIAYAVKSVPETELAINLNFFSRSEGHGGEIGNVRADNLTIGHLFRAAFQSMGESYYSCALKLWPEKSWRNLVFSGGLACKIQALRDEVQRRFASNYRMTPNTEDTLFGLLILAAVFSGRAQSVEQISAELRATFAHTESRTDSRP